MQKTAYRATESPPHSVKHQSAGALDVAAELHQSLVIRDIVMPAAVVARRLRLFLKDVNYGLTLITTLSSILIRACAEYIDFINLPTLSSSSRPWKRAVCDGHRDNHWKDRRAASAVGRLACSMVSATKGSDR